MIFKLLNTGWHISVVGRDPVHVNQGTLSKILGEKKSFSDRVENGMFWANHRVAEANHRVAEANHRVARALAALITGLHLELITGLLITGLLITGLLITGLHHRVADFVLF